MDIKPDTLAIIKSRICDPQYTNLYSQDTLEKILVLVKIEDKKMADLIKIQAAGFEVTHLIKLSPLEVENLLNRDVQPLLIAREKYKKVTGKNADPSWDRGKIDSEINIISSVMLQPRADLNRDLEMWRAIHKMATGIDADLPWDAVTIQNVLTQAGFYPESLVSRYNNYPIIGLDQRHQKHTQVDVDRIKEKVSFLTADERRRIVKILGYAPSDMTDDEVYRTLYDIINRDDYKTLSYIETAIHYSRDLTRPDEGG